MEYHLRLVEGGFKVHFLDSVTVLSDAPNQTANATVQRTRWEGGRFRLIFEHVPALFAGVLRGKARLIEPLAELLLLPLAYHVLLLLFTLALPSPMLRCYALTALLLVGVHVLIALRSAGDSVENLKALARVPFYIVWKVLLIPKLWRNAQRNAQWQRTDREDS
jgi:cellulose synthase/poly-beta-1,6-N-acetylglucosamine synthase-like glycosyltransferase